MPAWLAALGPAVKIGLGVGTGAAIIGGIWWILWLLKSRAETKAENIGLQAADKHTRRVLARRAAVRKLYEKHRKETPNDWSVISGDKPER